MGPEGEKKYTLCLCDPKLGNVPLEPDVIYSFTFSADVLTPEAMALFQPTELTMRFKTPKHWRCRSRKRFIKLAMSKRISRNYAVWLADWVRKAGYSYAQAWRSWW